MKIKLVLIDPTRLQIGSFDWEGDVSPDVIQYDNHIYRFWDSIKGEYYYKRCKSFSIGKHDLAKGD